MQTLGPKVIQGEGGRGEAEHVVAACRPQCGGGTEVIRKAGGRHRGLAGEDGGGLGGNRLVCRVFVRMWDPDASQERGMGTEGQAAPSPHVQGLRETLRDTRGTHRAP